MSRELTYIVFTDFDGTISPTDIGDAMFERFGDAPSCLRSYDLFCQGDIDARECWRQGCATISSVTRKEFEAFALQHPIDEGFKPFLNYCASKKISVIVLSDGFDAYIDPVLVREELAWLPRFSNRLLFHTNGTVEPFFPFTDAECNQCANCKRNHVLTNAGDDHVIVYIGDGHSDRCPVRYADIVFAKGELVRFCEMNNITFHRFASFSDILHKFRSIVEKGKPRKRRTAELARREIFMME